MIKFSFILCFIVIVYVVLLLPLVVKYSCEYNIRSLYKYYLMHCMLFVYFYIWA